MDRVVASLALLLTAPLVLVIAAFIKLDSPGPVLFLQWRVGLFGKPFRICNLRTMVANAEELLEELIDIEELEEPVFKRPRRSACNTLRPFLAPLESG